MQEELEKKVDELFDDIVKFKKEQQEKSIQDFMKTFGEKNYITAKTIVNDVEDWVVINLRRFIVKQDIKIYCIQIKDNEGKTGIWYEFFSSFEEAEKEAKRISEEEKNKNISEILVDLLFKT